MAYTPPSGTAVDFQLSGTAYTPPVGTAVDFESPGSTAAIKFPCSIVSEANHQLAFVGAIFAVVFDADANHQVAFTTSGETPALISGDSRQLIAFTTSGELPVDMAGDSRQLIAFTNEDDVGPGNYGSALYFVLDADATFYLEGTKTATCQLNVHPAIVGDARMVYAASAAITFSVSVAAEAQYVYSPSADIEFKTSITGLTRRGLREASANATMPVVVSGDARIVYRPSATQAIDPIIYAPAAFICAALASAKIDPAINGAAYIKGVEAAVNVRLPVSIAGVSRPGTSASAAMVFPIRIVSTTNRKFRASSNNKLRAIIIGVAA
jgi:hypothetical protein